MSLSIPFPFGWLLNRKAARVQVNISLAFLQWVGIALHPWPFVSDIAIFVLKGNVKLQLTLSHNNAIAGITSQSLGLPAYACKTDSSTAIKLAPKMHQNLPFELPGGEGDTPSSHFTPSAPCSSRSPWFVPHFLNRGYAPDRRTGTWP